ncbi:MAG TPA: DUF1585 domain-containing protein, partial [Woeseiaceae bacterium]
TCQGCHGLIDPPGLALENFDVTGRWRDFDAQAKAPIDAKTELSSGIVLHGPADLRRYLNSRQDQFPTTVTKRAMMYALNREIEYFDMPQVRQIVRDAAASNYSFNAIVTGIVNSDAFRRQGPEEGHPNQAVDGKVASSTLEKSRRGAFFKTAASLPPAKGAAQGCANAASAGCAGAAVTFAGYSVLPTNATQQGR